MFRTFTAAIVTPAFANEFQVTFNYDRSAPAAAIYADFEATADTACRRRSHGIRGVQARLSRRDCATDLIEKAVHGTRLPELVAHHELVSNGDCKGRHYAALRRGF